MAKVKYRKHPVILVQLDDEEEEEESLELSENLDEFTAHQNYGHKTNIANKYSKKEKSSKNGLWDYNRIQENILNYPDVDPMQNYWNSLENQFNFPSNDALWKYRGDSVPHYNRLKSFDNSVDYGVNPNRIRNPAQSRISPNYVNSGIIHLASRNLNMAGGKRQDVTAGSQGVTDTLTTGYFSLFLMVGIAAYLAFTLFSFTANTGRSTKKRIKASLCPVLIGTVTKNFDQWEILDARRHLMTSIHNWCESHLSTDFEALDGGANDDLLTNDIREERRQKVTQRRKRKIV